MRGSHLLIAKTSLTRMGGDVFAFMGTNGCPEKDSFQGDSIRAEEVLMPGLAVARHVASGLLDKEPCPTGCP
jgi:hypothetical protein